MPFCQQCGYQIPESALFCQQCGQSVGPPPTSQPGGSPPANQADSGEDVTRKHLRLATIGFFSVFGVAIVVVFLVAIFSAPSSEDTYRSVPTRIPLPTLTLAQNYTCERLANLAVDLSEENQTGLILLKVYSPVRTIEKPRQVECKGTGLWSNGDREPVIVHADLDTDGDVFYGYRPGF